MMGGAWHSSGPCRPTSCTGQDPKPSEPALCAAALGQSSRAWNHDTSEVAGSNPALGSPEARRPDRHPPTHKRAAHEFGPGVDALLSEWDKSFD